MIEFFGTNANQMAKELGYPRAQTIYDIMNGKSAPSFDFLSRFEESDYANKIDISWLLTGKGKMEKEELNAISISDTNSSYIRQSIHDHAFASQEIPLYDINAAAGLKMLFQNDHQNIIDTIKIPNLTKCDGAIFINGDSMYPLMKSGDIVLFKEVYNIDYLHYGDIYLLSYEINGDYYLVIKYVQRSDIKDHIKLVSYNKYHEPIDIPLSAITAIALVKANIRYNTMQ